MKPAKGLKIKDLRVGNGREVAPRDIVHFHWTCHLSKGDVIFTTRGDAPHQMRVGTRENVLALDQGLIGMRVGGVRQIKVQPHLTYDERKVYPNLPKDALLIYEVELIRISDVWDNTLFIRESPIYSAETRALEERFRELEPTPDPTSEFQQVQAAMFAHAEREYEQHKKSKPDVGPSTHITPDS